MSSPGHHLSNSRFQFFLSVFGQTINAGNIVSPLSCSCFNALIACAVLPRPGSSASRARRAVAKNFTPALWCGNRSSFNGSSRVSRSRNSLAGVILLVSSLPAQSVNLGPITRSFLNVDRSARHVAQLAGTLQTIAVESHFAPGILLQSSFKRHSAFITTCLLFSLNSTLTGN